MDSLNFSMMGSVPPLKRPPAPKRPPRDPLATSHKNTHTHTNVQGNGGSRKESNNLSKKNDDVNGSDSHTLKRIEMQFNSMQCFDSPSLVDMIYSNIIYYIPKNGVE